MSICFVVFLIILISYNIRPYINAKFPKCRTFHFFVRRADKGTISNPQTLPLSVNNQI